jgi:arsenate reductase
MSSILILCPDNTCLSKMAEAYLCFYAQGEYEVYSAGLRTDRPVHPDCLRALAGDKLEVSSTQPQDVQALVGRTFDFLLSLDYGPTFAVPADLQYHHHSHYELAYPAKASLEERYILVLEEVKRAVLHYIGSRLRTRKAS